MSMVMAWLQKKKSLFINKFISSISQNKDASGIIPQIKTGLHWFPMLINFFVNYPHHVHGTGTAQWHWPAVQHPQQSVAAWGCSLLQIPPIASELPPG